MSRQIIRYAMRHKQPITATYLGKHRILCPHLIGIKNGVWNVLSCQSGGESNSGLGGNPATNWRCMRVSELLHVELAPYREWQTAPRDTWPQTCIDVVDQAVVY